MTSSGSVLPATKRGWHADIGIGRRKHAPSVGVPVSLELATLVMHAGTSWPTPSGPASLHAPPLTDPISRRQRRTRTVAARLQRP
jgi:hypothetical protein